MRLASLCTDMPRRYGSDETAERKIHPRRRHLGALWNAVLVHLLKVFHDEQIAVVQFDVDHRFGSPVAHLEGPRGPQAEAGNARLIDFGFVVTVPPHAVLSIAVPVDQDAVVRKRGQGFHPCLERMHFLRHGALRPRHKKPQCSNRSSCRSCRSCFSLGCGSIS